jgi:hypothetical protein
MALYTTYDTVGIKEDVSDVISNLSPTKTPFQTMIGSDKTRNRHFSWLEDSLRAVQVNAQVEGFTAADATLTPPVSRDNYTQILSKTFKISETEDAVDQYGRKKETAYQTAIAMEEVKRDLENAMVGLNQAAVAGDTAGPTARKMASAIAQVDASTTQVNGAPAALTEAMVTGAHQKAYNAGADPSVLMIKPADSLIVAGFTGAAGRNRTFNDGQKTVTNVVNLYVSPVRRTQGGPQPLPRVRPTRSSSTPICGRQVTLRPWTREVARQGRRQHEDYDCWRVQPQA